MYRLTLERMGAVALMAILETAVPAQVSQPQVLHGTVQVVRDERDLAREVARARSGSQPVWLGYDVRVRNSFSSGWNPDPIVYLEQEHSSYHHGETNAGKQMEFDHATLLLRLSDGGVSKVRLEAPDRQLDTGGTRVVWLERVDLDQSVRLLISFATAPAVTATVRDQSIFAIAEHDTTLATGALSGMTAAGQPPALRKAAAFWLASARGDEGLTAIEALTRSDPDTAVRKELTFDLTLISKGLGLRELVRMAHEDASPEVRKQAQFWMAVRGGSKVAPDLRNAAEKDPDAEVRKAAVFALTQLPKEDAAPELIAVAESSQDAGVRKQAVFWLGQSSDPRALDYLTRLLDR